VLVIDNGSTDDTFDVAMAFTAAHPCFRFIVEPRQGLAYARNRGWQEARGDYVAYIDDDARPDAGWIAAIERFADTHPNAAVFGGPYRAFSPTRMPDWFPREYGSWDLGHKERRLSNREYLNGTNMVFRRNDLQSMGGFKEALGMRGTELGYGEETELMMRMHERQMEIYYSPAVVVEHAVLDYKMHLRWLLKSAYRNGRSGPRFHGERHDHAWIGYAAQLLWGAVTAARIVALGKDRHAKTRIYRALAPLMWQIGYFVALLRRPDR
jgi:glycosyltransferase involved in cell wall biosynthesis